MYSLDLFIESRMSKMWKQFRFILLSLLFVAESKFYYDFLHVLCLQLFSFYLNFADFPISCSTLDLTFK